MDEPITLHPTQAPARDPAADAIAGHRVELQLLTTLKCNLKCTYCSLGVGEVLGSQTEVRYGIDELARFAETHLAGKEVYVTFYGGEPTLNRSMMQQVMERFAHWRFQLQTNGTLLDDVPAGVLARLSNVLVSIDGGEHITDGYRGKGIYRQVLKNLERVHRLIGGTVTARVTWGNPATTFEELDALVADGSPFDYLYWQFVADEMYAGDSVARREQVLVRLIERFFARTDRLYPLIPLMGIVRNKLLPGRAQELYGGRTQCRVSSHLLNVMPDGQIYPCPDMMYVPQMLMGSVKGNWLKPSPLQHTDAMPCRDCEACAWCRGNCMKNLYLGYVKNDLRYRHNVVEPICSLVRFVGREIDRHDPQAWFARLPVPLRRQLTDCEVYEYVEVMP
ncbi:MAG: radical SAM protein [Piscinibacter sp.]|uniref:radical SAM/SPASM domain-containing protein n=1 Tax=Piscinibacter sp. TaxID=1903157 RepID=UPI0011D7609C|nr:radical SAM protein [Piscinibacter sp.]MBP5991140.1 radical SAM protein [Piscinibacter sp.]MBP6028352.1 radical SAM protein [Piscinibacter sp.]TXH58532.1 MAG: radical SAM protein [Burkholderiaceae bacterium]